MTVFGCMVIFQSREISLRLPLSLGVSMSLKGPPANSKVVSNFSSHIDPLKLNVVLYHFRVCRFPLPLCSFLHTYASDTPYPMGLGYMTQIQRSSAGTSMVPICNVQSKKNTVLISIIVANTAQPESKMRHTTSSLHVFFIPIMRIYSLIYRICGLSLYQLSAPRGILSRLFCYFLRPVTFSP